MIILSIETSCDETGISILEVKNKHLRHGVDVTFRVLADSLSSQVAIHAPYGGVYPMLAKREHIKNLPILLKKTLKKAKVEKTDLIAVTSGPGLEPALWTGIVFAKELAKKWKVPLVSVNHMEGHILSVFGEKKGKFTIPKIKFPVLSLLVSGGHTELVLVKDWMQYKIIGETLDDAAGEAFDKVARMLGLPYPGGPEISKLAEEERRAEVLLLRGLASATARTRGIFQQKNIRAPQKQTSALTLPRPMLYTKNFDFSFSGLKTAVLYLIKKIGSLDEEIKSKIALEFENAVVETLIYKTKKAMEKYKAKTLIVAGGVAANKHLRKEIKKVTGKNTKLLFPTQALSTDNSIMIGIAGYLNFIKKGQKPIAPSKIKAEGGLRL
jgi:N6-L-threonylcarbamoyladenine synthase